MGAAALAGGILRDVFLLGPGAFFRICRGSVWHLYLE